jgi:hypothetical protein
MPGETAEISERIRAPLDGDPRRPWCVHRLFGVLSAEGDPGDRDLLLEAIRHAADELAARGQARREWVSTVRIGVPFQDSLYWSVRSPHRSLAEFGPEYEPPVILHRLASHLECRGL